jgi:uncharacterized membrane protein
MSLQPLLAESIVVQLHAFAAIAAFLARLSQFILPKGTWRHRIVGYGWLAFMLIVALISFGIHQIRQFGPWSLIHLLSIYTLAVLPLAVLQACRRGLGHKKPGRRAPGLTNQIFRVALHRGVVIELKGRVGTVLLGVEHPPTIAESSWNFGAEEAPSRGIAIRYMNAGDLIVAFVLEA